VELLTTTPKILRRPRLICAGLVTLSLAAWVALILVGDARTTLVNAALLTAVFAPVWWLAWAEVRVRRRLRQTDGRLCPACGHSLVGLGDGGRCPECGRAFILDADREMWIGTGLIRRAEFSRGHRA